MPKIRKEDAAQFEKFGVKLWDFFPDGGQDAGDVLYVETEEQCQKEFSNQESHFFYYVLRGDGTFVIDGEDVPVTAGELVHIPPDTKVYYKGALEMILFASPPWHEDQEIHHRYFNEEGDA